MKDHSLLSNDVLTFRPLWIATSADLLAPYVLPAKVSRNTQACPDPCCSTTWWVSVLTSSIRVSRIGTPDEVQSVTVEDRVKIKPADLQGWIVKVIMKIYLCWISCI
jgi:hypothetical protein